MPLFPPSPLIHRSRQLAAKIIRRVRRVHKILFTPSVIEQRLARLPVVESTASLDDKVVVITGSTRGIGKVLARSFLRDNNCRVVVNGRDEQALADVVGEFSETHRVFGVSADVSTEEGVDKLIDQTISQFGRLDILINNAAIAGPWGVKAWQAEPAAFTETIQANLTGPFIASIRTIQWMLENEIAGRIINVSSIVTVRPQADVLAYGVTKCALEALTTFLAHDLGDCGIGVTAVSLPSLRTEAKQERSWADAELLPPSEIVVPVFEYAATAPLQHVHGRVISAQNFLQDADAETLSGNPSAVADRLAYPPYIYHGQEIDRDPERYTFLDRAENRYGPSEKVQEAILKAARKSHINYYPDQDYAQLTSVLATQLGLGKDQITIGNGSWEIINRLLDLFAGPGEQVLTNAPGWFGFNALAERKGIILHKVPFNVSADHTGDSHNLAGFIDAICPQTRLIYLISPSNPEGLTLSHASFVDFLDQVPETMPILIDEAYIEYASDPARLRSIKLLLDGRRNVIILRTFSKFYGLAGLRIGYALADPSIIRLLVRVAQIFPVSSISEEAAVAALLDKEHQSEVYKTHTDERERLFDALEARNYEIVRSQAPYFLIRKNWSIETLVKPFEDAKIFITRFDFYGGEYAMLPIGDRAENDRLIELIPPNF